MAHFYAVKENTARWSPSGTYDLADRWLAKRKGLKTARDAEKWRKSQPTKLSWHHLEDCKTLLLVPRALHEKVPHAGGASMMRNGLCP